MSLDPVRLGPVRSGLTPTSLALLTGQARPAPVSSATVRGPGETAARGSVRPPPALAVAAQAPAALALPGHDQTVQPARPAAPAFGTASAHVMAGVALKVAAPVLKMRAAAGPALAPAASALTPSCPALNPGAPVPRAAGPAVVAGKVVLNPVGVVRGPDGPVRKQASLARHEAVAGIGATQPGQPARSVQALLLAI